MVAARRHEVANLLAFGDTLVQLASSRSDTESNSADVWSTLGVFP